MNKLSVDFHTHVLAHIDDGSSSSSESVQMLKQEYNAGIKTVIATPHFYADIDRPERFLEKRQDAYNRLMEKIHGEENIPEIVLGAEVFYFDGIEDWDILPKLTLGNSNYILIELNRSSINNSVLESLAEFKSKTGLTPIIAHIDRYISAFKTGGLPEILSEMDVLIQMNTSFLMNFPDSLRAIKLLKNEQVHLLGSDCHNLTSRVPNMDKAQEIILKKAGEQTLNRLVETENQLLTDLGLAMK